MPPLMLDENELVVIPPAGKRTIFIDADDSIKVVDSDGAKSSLGGGTITTTNKFLGDGSVGDPLDLNPDTVALASSVQKVAGANTDTINFDVLDGDADKTYIVSGQFTCGNAGSLKVQPNGADTNAQSMSGERLTDGRSIANTGAMYVGSQFGGATNLWQANDVGVLNGIIHAASGNGWRAFTIWAVLIRGGNVTNILSMDGVWKDSATNLTSLKFLGTVANFFNSGSLITLTALGA